MAHRSRIGRPVLAALLLGLCGQAAQAQSDDQLWTDAPVRVDPSHQDLERLPDKPMAPVNVDPFPMRFAAGTSFRVLDSVTFQRGSERFRLAGIEPVPPVKTCRDADDARWACGLRARAALSGLLSRRAVRCAPRGRDGSLALVECVANRGDIGESLVAAGNATVGVSGGRYRAVEDEARTKKAGIWAAAEPGP